MVMRMEISNAIRFPILASSRSLPLNALLILAASLLIGLAAQVAIPIPFSPVPLTLQPLAVLLVGATLGPVRGAAAASLYLLEGLAGLPVFAGGSFGPAVLLGPTAGYLYAFPAAAFIAGYANRSILRTSAVMVAAIVVIHLGGWSWLAGAIGAGTSQAFAHGVAPFLINDVLKAAIATAIAVAAHRK